MKLLFLRDKKNNKICLQKYFIDKFINIKTNIGQAHLQALIDKKIFF